MKKFWIYICIDIFLGIVVYFIIIHVYSLWARRQIYPTNNTSTEYPGYGHISRPFSEQIFVLPKGEGRPKFDNSESKSIYPADLYDIFTIPSQDQLLYVVGSFQMWEDISGSKDKYIVIKNPETKKLEKFRVAFEQSDLFKDNETALSIENISLKFGSKKLNEIEKPKTANLYEIGYEKMIAMISKGDTVIIEPVFDPPDLSKKDENRNFLASWLILRKVGGNL